MIEITRETHYALRSPFSRIFVLVSVKENGAGSVFGWIRRDSWRLEQIDAYVAKNLRYTREWGDHDQFNYVFGPGALSDQVALDLNAIMDTESARERQKRLKKEAEKATKRAKAAERAPSTRR